MTLNEKWSSIEPKIDARIIKAINDGFGFEYVMPVQKVVLPHFMQNHDVAVQVSFFSNNSLGSMSIGCYWFRKDSFFCDSHDSPCFEEQDRAWKT